ncbi:MAG: glycosyltransferase, partial [Chloroflexota bacterium]
PLLVARNAPRLRATLRDADVVLLRLPASNGLLAALAAVARGVPRVAYVVGSVRDVVAGQRRRGAAGLAARTMAAFYDGATRLAAAGAPVIVAGADPAGGGIASSLVAPDEIRDRGGEPWPAAAGVLRLVYAGRLADGKGLDTLLDAVAILADVSGEAGDAASGGPGGTAAGGPGDPVDRADAAARHGADTSSGVTLDLVGDGPAAATLRDRAAALGIADRVRFGGYLAERGPYLAALAAADLFVSPSPSEGFPKAVLDAMAAGTPVMAVPAGRLAELADSGLTPAGAPILTVPAGDPAALAGAIRTLVADPSVVLRLRAAGTAFVAEHTAPAEAARLLDRLRAAALTRSRRRR